VCSSDLRKASTRKPEVVLGPSGRALGYSVDLSTISVAEENIFYNYDDSEAAQVIFTLANSNQLILYFPEQGACNLLTKTSSGRIIESPAQFLSQFDCPIGFVPILGPVEHNEPLFEKEAARRALFSYQAARNFRNIWYHYPEKFEEFRDTLRRTWPGMDIEKPTVHVTPQKPRLHMFCPESRIPREIFWSGFGFQVWCQMLTHLIQSHDKALFLIDEPDIYLHSDLQRQLLSLLRNLGPDIVIATHSTEIVTEAEPDDLVLVNKRLSSARRIKNPSQLTDVFAALGSNLNPILTQLAKTRRAVFVEGTDFQILGRFASKLGHSNISNRSEFAVIGANGFNPERVRNLKDGMEITLGGKIRAASILDRDFRSVDECTHITKACEEYCDLATIHSCKEIENFLLVPNAIDRAAALKVAERNRRSGENQTYSDRIIDVLDMFSDAKKNFVAAQHLAKARQFNRASAPKIDDATVTEFALKEFEAGWQNASCRLAMLPGKEAISAINIHLQNKYKISVTPATIIDAMQAEEIPKEMKELLQRLKGFLAMPLPS
jgi:hypothetical protein